MVCAGRDVKDAEPRRSLVGVLLDRADLLKDPHGAADSLERLADYSVSLSSAAYVILDFVVESLMTASALFKRVATTLRNPEFQ